MFTFHEIQPFHLTGAFIHEGCEDEFCSTSHLRNETKSLYVVLSYKDLQLKCVDKVIYTTQFTMK